MRITTARNSSLNRVCYYMQTFKYLQRLKSALNYTQDTILKRRYADNLTF